MYFIIIIMMIVCACTAVSAYVCCSERHSARRLRGGFYILFRFVLFHLILLFLLLLFSFRFVLFVVVKNFLNLITFIVLNKTALRETRNVKRLSKQTIINAFVNKTKQFNYFGCKTIVVVFLLLLCILHSYLQA